MLKVSLKDIIRWTGGELICKGNVSEFSGIFSDSRKIIAEGIFIAFKGEHFDGNLFASETLLKGAAAAIVSVKLEPIPGKTLIYVSDTLIAYQRIANGYRNSLNVKVAAITGSVGKTTTKEILGQCLQTTFETCITAANHNNDIGVPETLLSFNETTEMAVVEMGMRGLGEIERLSATANPDYVIITNIAPVHLELLGSMENIACAKCEIFSYLKEGGVGLISAENPLLLETANKTGRKFYTFGKTEQCDCYLKKTILDVGGMTLTVRLFNWEGELFFPIASEALALDVLAACGCAYLMGVPTFQIVKAIEKFTGDGKRLHIESFQEGGFVIDDAYNANPDSMAAALNLLALKANYLRKVAVLGDMYELGSYSLEGHFKTGQIAEEVGVNVLITIGKLARGIAKGYIKSGGDALNVHSFSDSKDALLWMKENIMKTDAVLFKASNGRRLDLLLKQWLDEGDKSHA